MSKNYSISIIQIIIFSGILFLYYCINLSGDTTNNENFEVDFSCDKTENYSVDNMESDTIVRNMKDYKFNNFQVIQLN